MEQQTLDRVHVEYATDIVLGDTDSFADWLAGECFGQNKVTSAHESRDPQRLLNASVPTLVAAMLRAADRGDAAVCVQAVELLKGRFTQTQDARIVLIATEAACEVAA